MPKILVVDDQTVIREPIAACLRQAGHLVTCASNGHEGLAAVKASRPDLILLDLTMPQMDGISMLREVRGQKSGRDIQVILLTSSSDKRCVVDAAKLGVKGYLLKDRFSLEELLLRIGQLLNGSAKSPEDASPPIAPALSKITETVESPAPVHTPSTSSDLDMAAEALARALGVPRLLTREQCLERAEKALQGKALSGVVAQVIQLAASPHSNTAQVAESISHDPMLTAKILRVANSAVYTTGRGPVTSIPDAIKKVGFSTIRNIAATVGVIEAMLPGGSKDSFDPIRSWQHSFAVAMLCERFASNPQEPGGGDTAIGYLIGLCHDLGEILFQTCYGKEYKQVLDAHSRTGHPMAELERAMLGMPCSELILLTLRSLQLPDAIRLPIEAMHGSAATTDRLCQILRLADIYANGMQLASSTKSPLRSFTTAECESALGSANGPKLDREKIRAEIFALTAMLSLDNPGSTMPMFDRTRAKTWLVREPGLSKLDPVEAALESLAEVKVTNRLPTTEEAANIKALVVEARTACAGGFNPQNLSVLRMNCERSLPMLWLILESETPMAQMDPDLPRPIVMPVPLEILANLLKG